jgi:hypothetical protein
MSVGSRFPFDLTVQFFQCVSDVQASTAHRMSDFKVPSTLLLSYLFTPVPRKHDRRHDQAPAGEAGRLQARGQPDGAGQACRSSDGAAVLWIQAMTAWWRYSSASRPCRRHVSITEKLRARNSSPCLERVGPEILRLSTNGRSARSASLFVVHLHPSGLAPPTPCQSPGAPLQL